MITSTSNPRVKSIARLRTRRERDTTHTFSIEGSRVVERAVASGWDLTEAYCAPGLATPGARRVAALVRAAGVAVTELGDEAFRRAAYRSHPDGVLAIGKIPELDVSRLDSGTDPLILVVEAIEKPGNLGAMLRTADAVGVDAVVVADPTVDPWNPNSVRASQGALFSVPIGVGSAADVESWLVARSIRVVAAVPDEAAPDPWAIDLTGAAAIVVGSEHAGVSALWRTHHSVRIPMSGVVDSLNASVAAAVLLYEARRQRQLAG